MRIPSKMVGNFVGSVNLIPSKNINGHAEILCLFKEGGSGGVGET